ncbi:MAG: SMC-Scp complex subunit ScpB [Chlorobiaceae bacterium]|nr:SMC-Scp complex subunit ScpB [Chlorobiaceae bacterium]NTV16840.1 SMC-Scp complex subunit ScpB [Chlorobiaceae bacterium]
MQKQEIQLQQQVEALIFASEEAVTLQNIRQVTGFNFTSGELHSIVERLNRDYEESGRCFQIHRIAGGYRFLTRPEYGDILKKLLAPKIRRKLSLSQLEVLAVIAYNQPVTRAEIQQIRGVSPDYSLDRLLLRGFIEVLGRADSPGKPLQYGTTMDFLDLFHLSSLKELPKLREIQEILQEHNENESLNRLNGNECTSFDNEPAGNNKQI